METQFFASGNLKMERVFQGTTYVMKRHIVQCRKCLDTIETTDEHDLLKCSCGAIGVDGGVERGCTRHGKREDARDFSIWVAKDNPNNILPQMAAERLFSMPNRVNITAVLRGDTEPPKTLEVEGHTIHLEDYGKAIGMDKDKKVWFRFEKSNEIEPGEVSQKSLEYLQQQVQPCADPYCSNQVLQSGLCWVHSTSVPVS
jgi:hypothetical protein